MLHRYLELDYDVIDPVAFVYHLFIDNRLDHDLAHGDTDPQSPIETDSNHKN